MQDDTSVLFYSELGKSSEQSKFFPQCAWQFQLKKKAYTKTMPKILWFYMQNGGSRVRSSYKEFLSTRRPEGDI